MSEFLSEEDSQNLRNMVDELLSADEGLLDKEITFLDSIKTEWEGNLTERQGSWIEKIYKRIFK